MTNLSLTSNYNQLPTSQILTNLTNHNKLPAYINRVHSICIEMDRIDRIFNTEKRIYLSIISLWNLQKNHHFFLMPHLNSPQGLFIKLRTRSIFHHTFNFHQSWSTSERSSSLHFFILPYKPSSSSSSVSQDLSSYTNLHQHQIAHYCITKCNNNTINAEDRKRTRTTQERISELEKNRIWRYLLWSSCLSPPWRTTRVLL